MEPTPQGPWTAPGSILVPISQAGRFLALLHQLDRFSGHWFRLRDQAPEAMESLRQVATIESAGASTRIEGAELSNEEVAEVLKGIHVDSFRDRDQQEVRGYGDLLQLIFESHHAMPISESTIKSMHGVLLRYSDKDQWHRGDYKRSPNHVEMTQPDGRRITVFQTAPPPETRWWMTQLIEEFNAARASGQWHPLVLIADFVGWFLAIHPFQDGNGRLSRALTTLLLLQAGYAYVPYASLEGVIEDNKPQYYAALRAAQTAMVRDATQYGDWLGFFLAALRSQQERLQVRIDATLASLGLPPAHRRLVEAIRERGPQTSAALAQRLGMSDRTVRYHLAALVKAGQLAATSRTAGRLYSLPPGDPMTAETRALAIPPAINGDDSPDRVFPVAASTAEPPTEPVFDVEFQRHAGALPNGRAYATVVIGAVPSTVTRLHDAELDAFDDFVAQCMPGALAVRATPDVDWWHIAEEMHSDRLSIWLHPGPVVEVDWGVEPEMRDDLGPRTPIAVDAIALLAYWRQVLQGVSRLFRGLDIERSAVAFGLQTLPASGGEIRDLNLSPLPSPRRVGERTTPSPWRHEVGVVPLASLSEERILGTALDNLLRHFSYRHTSGVVEAMIELSPREWSPTRQAAYRLT